jgi:hypothetical protein
MHPAVSYFAEVTWGGVEKRSYQILGYLVAQFRVKIPKKIKTILYFS